MQEKGFNGQIVAQFETTFGQDPDTPDGKLLPFNTCELTGKQGLIDPATIRKSRSEVRPGLGRITAEGPITIPMCFRSIGFWLKALFGSPTGTDQAGYLLGGTGVTTTIGTWTAITDGSFNISIDGSANDITGITFAGDTTMTDVAADIQTAIRAIGTGGFTLATVEWIAATAQFKITSGTTGASSAVGALAAAASGTNISGASLMKCHAAVATIVDGDQIYKKEYKITTNAQPSMVIEKGFGGLGQYFKYNGCKVNNFKLAFGNDGELVANLDILAANETPSATPYDATPTEMVLARINNVDGSIKENGVVSGIIKSGDITIAAGLDPNQYIFGAGNKRGDIPEGMMKVSGNDKSSVHRHDAH
jgi:hypothetical protein